ncbi:hypothetical protein [Streptomyces somaliensis]|uniref:hypothetical protein n=1 Tax=Streptomyces somaliensis TaxID=78355 RepID=UPI0034E9385D|nr:hypothetical protein [Streptomyces somaliensis]
MLGAWVPTWRPRPCGNPECDLFGRPPHEAAGPPGNDRSAGPPGNDRGDSAEIG